MTVPKWLIPVLAAVAALGIGIAASLFATRFATPTAAPVEPRETENIPVILPVDGDGAFPAESDEGFEVSEASGGATVVVPEEGSDYAAEDLAAEAEAVAAGSLIPVDGDAAADDPASRDEAPLADPCDADPSADGCDGVMSTVFALTAPPPFAVELNAASSCGGVGDDTLTFVWRSTQPGSFSVRAYQSDPDYGIFGIPVPDARLFTTSFVTPDDQNLAWDDAREADAERLPTLGGCEHLAGLDPDTYYTVEVTGVSRDGEIILRTYEFLSHGDYVRRGMTIAPASGSGGGWTASLVHVAEEQFAVRAFVLPPHDSDTPECSGAADDYDELDAAYRTTATLSPARTAALGVPRDVNQNTVFAFLVPQGAKVLYCGYLYNGPDSPSYDRENPIRTYAQVGRAAGWWLPRVLITGGELFRDDVVVHLSASTGDGYTCGAARIEPGQDLLAEPLLLCFLEHFGERYRPGTGFADSIDPWDQEVTVAIRATVELPNGDELRSSQALDLTVCSYVRGDCFRRLNGEQERYDIALPSERVSSGLCGSLFGADCTPPTRENATGVIKLTVDWPDTNTGGDDRVYGAIPQDDVAFAAALEPQLNTDNRIYYRDLDVATGSGIAAIDLVTDRETDYRVELLGMPGLDPCTVGGAPLVATGHSTGDTRVEIPGVCYGAMYFTRITLTADGHESVWGLGETHQWLGGWLRMPPLEGQVVVTAFHGETDPGSMLERFSLELDGQDLGLTSDGGNCVADGDIDGAATVNVGVSSRPELAFDIVVRETRAEAFGVCSGGDYRDETFSASMFLDTADLVRHPDGFDYAVGPYSFHLKFTPLR